MALLALIISILAMIVAYLAYTKSGGSVEEMKRKVEDLGVTMESLRSKTADILENLEKKIRGEEKKSEDPPRG
jgi:hypothetical protein